MSVVGKRVFITGAASGLGKAISLAFAKAGAYVAVCDVDEKGLQQVIVSIQPIGKVTGVRADISQKAEAISAFGDVVKQFGSVDVLVNCAGIMDRFAGAGETDYDLWDRVIGVNLTAPFILSKIAIQEFLRADRDTGEGGTILNISSLAAIKSGFGGAAYAASKSGLVGLTKNTAALYHSRGIRSNAILPGAMRTNFVNFPIDTKVDPHGREVAAKISESNPGAIDLDKAGNLMVFLASDEGKDINGAVISLDRGWSTY